MQRGSVRFLLIGNFGIAGAFLLVDYLLSLILVGLVGQRLGHYDNPW
jgi:hypothetical protein